MKKISTLLYIIFMTTNLAAQDKVNNISSLPAPFVITSDTVASYIYLPDSCWQMLADPTGKITLQQALQSGNFQDTSHKIDYSINTYWIRYKLVNKMEKEVQVALWFGKIQYADLYTKTDSFSWQHYRNGSLVPWSRRDGLKSLKAVSLSIPPGKQLLIYQRQIFDYKISRPEMEMASFSFGNRVTQQQRTLYTNSLILVFVLGLIVLAIAINLY